MAVIKLPQSRTSRTAEYAFKYLDRGLALTQLKPQSKQPAKKAWQSKVITSPDHANLFKSHNIGFILGERSGDLTDIDLDTDEAVGLAPYLLPTTGWIYGRQSRPGSHFLYVVKGSRTQKFLEPGRDGGMILEIRSTGAQSMAPGSQHPDGETVRWETNWEDEDPTIVGKDDLEYSAQLLAAACLVLKHGWVPGKRDEVAVALCGLLLRADWKEEAIDEWLEAIAQAAGDEELDMRLKAHYQRERLKRNERVPGIPRLIDLMGKDITERVIEWLELKSGSVLEQINQEAAVIHDEGRVRIWNKKTKTLMTLPDARTWFATYKLRVRGPKGAIKEKRAFPVWEEYPQREEYSGLTFNPGEGVVVNDMLNLWAGFETNEKLVSKTEDQLRVGCEHFLRHLEKYVCQGDQDHYQYLLDWMSHLVQKPSQVPGVALVLRGSKGTGKTIVADYLISAIGRHYGTIITNPKHVFGRFNGILRNKLFACIDDITWAGGHEEEGILKNIITGNQITLEKKFAEVEDVRSFLRIMIVTNNEWAVPVSADERRYLILDLPKHLAPKSTSATVSQRATSAKHFKSLIAELYTGGPEHLFLYLMNREIGTHSFIQELPVTKGYEDSQMLSAMNQDPFVSWLNDCLEDQTWWNQTRTELDEWVTVSSAKLYNSYLNYNTGSAKRQNRMSRTWFSRKFLATFPGVKSRHRGVVKGSTRSTERVVSIPPYEVACFGFSAATGIRIIQEEE